MGNGKSRFGRHNPEIYTSCEDRRNKTLWIQKKRKPKTKRPANKNDFPSKHMSPKIFDQRLLTIKIDCKRKHACIWYKSLANVLERTSTTKRFIGFCKWRKFRLLPAVYVTYFVLYYFSLYTVLHQVAVCAPYKKSVTSIVVVTTLRQQSYTRKIVYSLM